MKNKKIFKLIILILTIAGFFSFRLKLEVFRKFSEQWLAYDINTESPDFECENFSQMISKPLKYLGNGEQAIAFTTDDGKYVVKFLMIKPIKGQKILRNFIKKMGIDLHREKYTKLVKRVMQSYVQAFQGLKEETGLIALHFRPTKTKLGYCEVLKDGSCFQVNLDRASFIVQHLGKPIVAAFSNSNCEEYQILYKSFEELLEKRARKGFTDLRKGFNVDNYAFINSQAAMIDPGNVVYSDLQKEDPESEVQRMYDLFHQRFSNLSDK